MTSDSYSSGATSGVHAASRAYYTRAAFEAYFWAADVIVAIGQTDDAVADHGGSGGGQVTVQAQKFGIGEVSCGGRSSRSWEDALVGFYYVKPNYPGRSSHVSCFFILSIGSFSPFTFLFLHSSRKNQNQNDARWVG